MLTEDRQILDVFAKRVHARAPSASIRAFGSRARGSADPESDLDVCVVVAEVTPDLRDAIYLIAWEIGFENGRLVAPIVLSEEAFDRGPLSASTLVANIRRDGVSA